MNGQIVLGCTYKDIITGFSGVAVGYVQYLTGCNQALLAPQGSDPTKKPDSEWFDVQRLRIAPDVDRVVLDNGATPGCDRAAPSI